MLKDDVGIEWHELAPDPTVHIFIQDSIFRLYLMQIDTMASKKQILNKLRILITQKFDDPEQAFQFFDKNSDGKLSASELKKLISTAEVSRFLSSIVANKLLNELDADQDRRFDWQEFRKAVKKLMSETEELA